MRVALPVPLIRAMDRAILQGLGGYTTRAEFIVDAIEERILELTVEGTEDSGAPTHAPDKEQLQDPDTRTSEDSFSPTALQWKPAGLTVALNDYAPPENMPLFGLHNRDYPSLWALSKLAEWTPSHTLPFEIYMSRICEEAWLYGQVLKEVEARTGSKCTALFPTNTEKRKPAETAFKSFAVGGLRTVRSILTTTGPLFEWRVASLEPGDDGRPQIGVTTQGHTLLASLVGTTVQEPHPAASSRAFMQHLSRHSPGDWSSLIDTLRAVGKEGATRSQLLHQLSNTWTGFTDNETSTNAAGYIARAREWGLLEPKQTDYLYHLTPLGLETVAGA